MNKPIKTSIAIALIACTGMMLTACTAKRNPTPTDLVGSLLDRAGLPIFFGTQIFEDVIIHNNTGKRAPYILVEDDDRFEGVATSILFNGSVLSYEDGTKITIHGILEFRSESNPNWKLDSNESIQAAVREPGYYLYVIQDEKKEGDALGT